jgi:hypothetical protein
MAGQVENHVGLELGQDTMRCLLVGKVRGPPMRADAVALRKLPP